MLCEDQIVVGRPARATSSGVTDRPLLVGAMIFGAAAIFYGAWLVWRTFLPLEIDYDEAWNAWQAQAAMGARALYPAHDALITNNYPPLSFYLLGMTAKLTGLDLILVGRLASLLGLGASAGAVAAIVRQLGGSRPAAGLGAAWYLGTMAGFCSRYVGMNDPTLLALGIMAWALVLFIRCHRTGQPVHLAILLMVVAGFFKHNLFATPATVIVWLWLERDHRKAARATLVGVVGAAVGLAFCTAAFGWAFVQQLFQYKRNLDLRLIWEARHQLATGTRIALLFGLLATWRRRTEEARLVFIYLVVGLIVFAVAHVGEGVDVNAGFELILASAVGLAWSLDRIRFTWTDKPIGPQTVRWTVVGVLAAAMLHSPNPGPYLSWAGAEFHRATALRTEAAEAEIARVRASPGPIFCPTMSVCFRAGRSFVYDHFAMDQRVRSGFWSPARLGQASAAAGIRTEPGTEVGAWSSIRGPARPSSGA